MTIVVRGVMLLAMPYEVELEMTEEAFDELSMFEKEDLLEQRIDIYNNLYFADVHDIDIHELEEVKDVGN